MADLQHLNMKKLRQVRVVSKSPGLHFINTAYMDETIVWKVQDGIVFAREISLTRHPEEAFEPRWKPVLQQENANEVIVYDWPFENELNRQKI